MGEEEGRRRSRSVDVEGELSKLPVDVSREDDELVVKVGKGRRLPEDEFRNTISKLKRMGFKFDPDTKTWRKRT
ncbi:MAG: hypothetical protein RXQ56_10205 [Thermoproteus sp.]|jgi:hypothetical protein|uniref:hypothetical protein n=1 Tax=Thermoproteus sp. CP80 TaxID=1650659 RepID=UPI00074A8EBF|nr:hypothetical protein [Thermoproteus sp. CP80]KUO84733.1 MAG: hypothetical protein AT711_04575 [Thermoproteus sp. CIS_19]KUO86932.1 MAG: hypothetical protein AT715_00860 [Thermoproteus sp. JCHS_4]MCI4464582.1 hypothetical protein [Thermoproteus sp.]MDT7869382.1 hypothetical protein [Thermoproteus sp.]MDT7881261.1 hypothetical protein [Thermoproteus sp.]